VFRKPIGYRDCVSTVLRLWRGTTARPALRQLQLPLRRDVGALPTRLTLGIKPMKVLG